MSMNRLLESAALSWKPMMQCWAPNVSMEEVMARFDEPAVPMTIIETIRRRWEGWELHTDWAFATPSFGSNFREDRRD